MTLIKVNARKNDSDKQENDTCEYESVQRRHLEKLPEIEVQSQTM